MLKYLLIFCFLTINLQPMMAQQPFLLPIGAKKVNVKSFLKEGFYLLLNGNFPDENQFKGIEIVKSYSEKVHIIHLKYPSEVKFPEQADLYEISSHWKLASYLQNSDLKGEVLLSISVLEGEEFKAGQGIEILQQFKNYYVIKASSGNFENILNDKVVTYISRYSTPEVETPVNQHDLTVNNINFAHHLYPDTRGENLKVSIKEYLFDTNDIDLINRTELSGLEADVLDRHATLIATLISGGGNSSSRGKGVAPAAIASSSSFLRIFPDENSYYINNEIYVQNHSYGTGIETEYGNEAAAYDANVNTIPELLHVFSAGNKGLETPETGNYAGIPGVANLTGNFKMAKNVITVGATDREKRVEERSSKGPANDGRVKPELVAYAPEGTSDAAALVSGTALLLQDLFKEREGIIPEVSLIKAVLIAGAEDVGAEHIDFSAGYGNLDAAKSLEILDAGTYIREEISTNESMEFIIDLPEGAQELKVALSWIDPAANPGDEVVLINDLNMEILGPDGNVWLPWILNTNPDDLHKPAQRGIDNLNPVELITLKNAAAGEYIVKVTAENFQEDVQSFSIAYSITKSDQFVWTFPTSDDALLVNRENLVRWENSFSVGRGKLEYRLNEEEWQLIGEDVDLKKGFQEWIISETSGKAQLKMTIGGKEFLSDFFAVSPELIPQVLYNCDEEVLIAWEKVENATGYQLQNLGSYYMEDDLEVEDTTAVIYKENFTSNIWSVVPLFEGARGPSGLSIDYTEQGVSCYYNNFYALLDEGPVVSATINLSTTIGVERVIFKRQSEGGISAIREFTAPLTGLQLNITDPSLEAGNHHFFATIILNNGREINTNGVDIFVPGNSTLEIYPNPVRAGEELSVISKGDDLEIQIFDMQGRLLSKDNLIRYLDRFKIKFYTRGLYILRTSREGKKVGVAKVLVN